MAPAVTIFLSILCLFSVSQLFIITAQDEHDYEAEAVSPAMAAFFGGDRSGLATPVSGNSTVPNWRLPAPELKQEQKNGLRMTVILIVGVVCGVIGVGLLVAAGVAYGAHVRRRSSRSEVRLGAVC